MEFYNEAIKKLKDCKVKGNKENAIKSDVIRVLTDFCKQEPEFAQAIAQSDKSLNDCLGYCVKGAGNSISDIEVYRRACAFWFPTATVNMVMTVDLSGNTDIKQPAVPKNNITVTTNKASEPESNRSVLSLSFSDLFD